MKKVFSILITLCFIVLSGCETAAPEKTTAADTTQSDTVTQTQTEIPDVTTAAPEPLRELKRDALPVDFIGHTPAQAEKIFDTAGGGFPCADGGSLNYWEDSFEKVYFSTHDESGDSNAIFKTVYCSSEGITLAPGLAAGDKYTAYKDAFPSLSECEYDTGCAYYTAGFDTVKDGGIPLHIYLCFYNPDDNCSGIIITSENLKGSCPSIEAQDRENYALFTLNRPYKDAIAKFGRYAFDYGDFDTPEAKSLTLAGINDSPIKVSSGDKAIVKTVSITTDELPILPGVRCGMDAIEMRDNMHRYIDSKSILAYGSVLEINNMCEDTGSVYCNTFRIGAMNVESYCMVDSDGTLTYWNFLAKSTY